MAVILIIAMMTIVAMPRLQAQIAIRELDEISRRFVSHANFARNQALHLGESVRMIPVDDNRWDEGWLVISGCIGKLPKKDCINKNWFSQKAIFPIYSKNRGFSDPHSKQNGLLFNPAGAARTAQGGFVANRLILGHEQYPELERHLVLSSGGRWRICDPKSDAKSCK
jgi:type IV fimbrial biogenesis protein FimT